LQFPPALQFTIACAFNATGVVPQQNQLQPNLPGFSFRPAPSTSSQQLSRTSNPPMTMQDMRSQLLNAQQAPKKAKTNVINPMELAANDPRLNLKPATAGKKKK
jgi:hypothetical protein